MLKEVTINDYHHNDGGKRVVLPLRFIPQNRYYPLLSIPAMYRGYDNPYFQGVWNKRTISRISDNVSINSSGYLVKYRRRGHYGESMNIFSGFLSALGTSFDFEYSSSSMMGKERSYRMKGDVDVFCLGLISSAHLPELLYGSSTPHYRRYSQRSTVSVRFDSSKVTILLNVDKLRKAQFCKDNYTVTVRSTLLGEIKRFRQQYQTTVEEVSDEEIMKYARSPHAVRTTSMVEMMKIKEEIKGSVFSNLNTGIAI